jgi:hypothetical protein
MSTSNDGTQIVIVLQPKGENETSELLTRLGHLVDLDPAAANSEVSDILADEELKRCMWATCEVRDLHSFAAYDALATTLEKMMALRPGSGGRLKAMIMIDDEAEAEAETETAAEQPEAAPLN